MKDVEMKNEALRFATLIMTQSTTANNGETVPSVDEVLSESKKIYTWFKESE